MIGGAIVGVVILAAVLFILLFDWDWLRGPISRYASARTGREVRIEGHLRVHPWSWTPRAEVQGLRIGNPKWVGSGDLAFVPEVDLSAKLLPLLVGRLDLPLLRLVQPRLDLVRDQDDRANWRFDSPRSSKPAQLPPAQLPPIQRFVIQDGRISMKDARRDLVLTGTVNAAENANGSGEGFRLTGQGTMNRDAFRLEATGGPLIHLERSRPYDFRLDLRAGPTHVLADGRLLKPFNLGQVQAELTASGPNLADLYHLTGVALPTTPPYSFTAHVDRQDKRFALTGLRGRVGDSDIEGSATLDKPGDRRMVTADLSSRRLVFSDLLAATGGGPKVRAAAAQSGAKPVTPPGRLLPEARLYRDRLQAMDAKVSYRAQSVVTARWPLRRVSFDLTLDHGVLALDPLAFEFPQGRLAGKVRIDARKAPAVSDLDMRLTGLALEKMLKAKDGGPPPIEGLLMARAQLHGRGDTVHDAASGADGRLVLVAPHGEIRQAFAELLGVNVANGLYLLLTRSEKETPLRCAVADFEVRNGVAQVSNAVFDTGVVRAQGKGSIDLRNETLDLRLEGQSKKPRILRVWAPITLKGTLLNPKPGVDAGKAAGQIGIAAAVGAVFAPLAAVLPFIEPGLAKDADCAALIGEAKAQGAPVKASQTSAPSKK
ncbi:MAG: AsmA family protein [Caulobacteraceae bacterium]